jgi:hypothetical protein
VGFPCSGAGTGAPGKEVAYKPRSLFAFVISVTDRIAVGVTRGAILALWPRSCEETEGDGIDFMRGLLSEEASVACTVPSRQTRQTRLPPPKPSWIWIEVAIQETRCIHINPDPMGLRSGGFGGIYSRRGRQAVTGEGLSTQRAECKGDPHPVWLLKLPWGPQGIQIILNRLSLPSQRPMGKLERPLSPGTAALSPTDNRRSVDYSCRDFSLGRSKGSPGPRTPLANLSWPPVLRRPVHEACALPP